jgi:tetratricopeptide (TPR) repeat protein
MTRQFSVLLAVLLSSLAIAQAPKITPQVSSIRISGLVRFGNTSAPRGVRIVAESRAGGIGAQTETNESGKFEITGLGSGVYTVRAEYPGYASVSEEADTRSTSTAFLTLTFAIPAGATPPSGTAPVGVPAEAQKEFDAGNKLLTEKKDLKSSTLHFKKATELYPAYGPAYFMLGTVYMDQQKWKEAQAALEKAIAIKADSSAAYLALGSCFAQQSKWAEAEKPLAKGLELQPESAMGQYDLGRVYWALNRWQDADPHAVKAVQLDPSNAPAHVMMGNIMLRRRDANGALAEFKKYLELEPKGPLADSTKQIVEKIEKALAGQK